MRTASCKKITINTSYFHADNMLAVCTHNKTSQPLPYKFTTKTLFYVSPWYSPIYSERNYKWAADVFAGIQKGCIVEYMQSENIPVYLSTCAFLK